MDTITTEELSDMLLLHRLFYIIDSFEPDGEGIAASYAEDILKALFPNYYKLRREDFGDTYLKAYGVIDDHVSYIISTDTAIRRLLKISL